MEAYEQWVRSAPWFVEARDFYAALCRASGGPVLLLEPEISVIGDFLASQGVEVRRGAGSSCGPFPLAVAPLRALNRLRTETLWRGTFAEAAELLAPEGRFVFDVRSPPDFLRREGERAARLAADGDAGGGRRRMIWETWRHDASGRRAECSLGIEDIAPDGAVAGKRYRDISFGLMGSGRIRRLAGEAGFEVDAVFGGFRGEPPAAVSPLRLWMLRLPGRERR